MAPTKKDADSTTSEAVRGLCALIASSPEFNPDYNIVATELGLSHAKNVPRKIESLIKPYGFALKNKKLVAIDANSEASATPSRSKSKNPMTPGASDQESDEKTTTATKKTSRTPKSSNTAGKKKTPVKRATTPTPRAKKRKVEEVDDEATKLIKESMGDGTDDETVKGAKSEEET